MRGPIVFSLLARRLPRTTPAKPCSGSTAMAPPVQPVWQIADEENPVRCRRARGCIRQGHTRQPRSTQTGETPVCSQPCPSLQLHKFGNRFPVRPRPRQAVAAAEAAERDLAVLGGDIDVRAPCRAALTAAQTPASPPPQTTKSALCDSWRTTGEFCSVLMWSSSGFVAADASANPSASAADNTPRPSCFQTLLWLPIIAVHPLIANDVVGVTESSP